MSARSRRPFIWEWLEDRTVPAVNFVFDYTYDVNDFFGPAERRVALERAASELEAAINDSIDAITPGGGNNWTASFFDPGTGSSRDVDDLTIPADTLLVFAGGRVLGGGILGVGGPGVGFSTNGGQAWDDLLESRGETGALASPATDFAPWGGSISFDTTTDFYFDEDISGIAPDQIDFQSTALHELAHLIGWGISDSWESHVSGTDFNGPNVLNTFGGPGPLDNDQSHWASGTTFNGVEAVMNVDTVAGIRQQFTDLDRAGLRDIGWEITLPNTPLVTLTVAPTSAVEGTDVVFTVNVNPPSGLTALATGTVTISANGNALITDLALDGTATATFTSNSFVAGSYTISASYSGDSNYTPAVSNDVDLTITASASPPTTPPTTPPVSPPPPSVPGVPPVTVPPTSLVGVPANADVLALGTTGGVFGYVFDTDQAQPVATQLQALFPGFSGASRGVGADVNGDGVADLIAVTGPEPDDARPNTAAFGSSVLTIIDGVTGKPLLNPTIVFEEGFRGGLFVAAGDIDGDGKAEIALSPDVGGGGRIIIYGYVDDQFVQRANFFGIDDLEFRGGARVAFGDVDGDGDDDLIVGAGFGGGPRVAIFDGSTLFTTVGNPVRLVADFFAFGGADAQNLRNGVFVAAGDLDGDGKDDIAFGSGPGGAPRVMVISGALLLPTLGDAALRSPLANFFAGSDTQARGGARVAFKDVDADEQADLIVGNGEDQVGNARVYLGNAVSTNGEPDMQVLIAAPEETFALRGVFVG